MGNASESLPMTDEASIQQRVRAEQLRVCFGSSGAAVAPAVVLGIICVAVLWQQLATSLLITWLIALVGSYGLRAALTARAAIPNEPDDAALDALDRIAVLTAALTGTAWGAMTLLPLGKEQEELLVFMGFVVCGVTASATPSLGSYRRAVFAFVLPCVLPLGARMLLQGTTIGLAMGLMNLLYLIVVYLTARRIAANFDAAVRLRMEADARRTALDRVRSQLEICVTDTPAAVAMFDRELRFITCSKQWLIDFGVQAQSLHGHLLYDAVPAIPARWRESLARALAGQVEGFEEDPIIRSDGTVRWLHWQARPWRESGGEVGGLVLFSTDVTEQKKVNDALHARERLLEQLTDRVPGLLFQMRVHADGRRSLLYVSSGSLRVLRMTPDVLIDNPDRIFAVCCAADRPALDAALEKADSSGFLQFSFRSELANGQMQRLSIQADATRLADASSVWHGYIEDVTERLYVEEHCRFSHEAASSHRVAAITPACEPCPMLERLQQSNAKQVEENA